MAGPTAGDRGERMSATRAGQTSCLILNLFRSFSFAFS